ncbi:MAG: AraC family transcriptional regulator [Clostridiaceae bacterium]|nr:AraC family transcriptional regulator [Clostridiaceae bacterium]
MYMRVAELIKKFKRHMSGSLFFKIFFICIFVSLFLIAFLGFYTHFYILKNLEDEIEKYEHKKLNETLSISNTQLEEMKKLTMSYALNNKFIQFAYMPRSAVANNYNVIKSNQDIMSNTVNSSNYIENICIFYEKNNYILDYSGVMDFGFYYDTGWHEEYESMTGPLVILDTRKVNKRNSLDSELYSNVITFMAKIPFLNINKEGAIILNVDVAIISDLLKNIAAPGDNSHAFLVNENGTILASNNGEYYYRNISEVIDLPSDFNLLQDGSFKFSVDGTKMVAYYGSSMINNWKMFYIESENAVFEQSKYIRNTTFIILAALLLVAALTSFLFSLKVYNPIKNIVANIKRMTTIDNENDHISDVSLIDGGVNLLFESKKALENQLRQNEILIREMFLSQLIRGKLFNKNEIESKAEYLSINLEADYYMVAIIQKSTLQSYPFNKYPLDIQNLELYKISTNKMVTNAFSALGIDVNCSQDYTDNILVLIKLRNVEDINESEAIVEQTLEDVKGAIEKQLSTSVSIGLGRFYSDLSNVGVSYNEAREALRYNFLKDDQSVISFYDISISEKDKLYYPVKSEQKLISFAQMADYEKTMQCLNEMIDDIMNHNRNFKHIELCLTNIIGLVKRCLYEMNLNPQDVFSDDTILNASIDSFRNIQHFTEWISTWFSRIIEYMIEQQKDDSRSFEYEVKDYIEKVYMKEISLDTVADHFKYNSSYFCKIFKEKLGVTFWEYVAQVRVDKSKKLLVDLDDTIEQIAEKVGYNNRFSYIRAFKKYTSLTPGEYRMKFKQTS